MLRRSFPSVSRRTFLGAFGLAALSRHLLAQTPTVAPAASSLIMPSAAFGTVTPLTVGVASDVPERLATYLQAQIATGEIPGAYVAAVRKGKVFVEECFGTFCDRTRREVPYDGTAIHPFHSISKMLSATVVVMAWQDGLIDLDAPLCKYVPEFSNGGKEAITIRQLLTHSAGIPKTPTGFSTISEENWKAAVASVCAEPLEWPPGSRTEYHAQTAMLMAAEAVRRVSDGKAWNTICRERLFAPLGLDTSTFDEPPGDMPLACVPRLANPAEAWQKQLDHFLGAPAAGLKGGFTDVLKFLAFQAQRGVWHGKLLLQEKFWTEMHKVQFPHTPVGGNDQPHFDRWGLGMLIRDSGPAISAHAWFGLRDVKGPRTFGHVGTNIAMALGDPDTDVQLVFMVTDTPKTNEKTIELRNTVSAIVFNSVQA